MNFFGGIGAMWLNGQLVSGGRGMTISSDGSITVNGHQVHASGTPLPPIKIELVPHGDLKISSEGNFGAAIHLEVAGNVEGSIRTMSGGVDVAGDVAGGISTMSGSVVVGGATSGASISSMSGSVSVGYMQERHAPSSSSSSYSSKILRTPRAHRDEPYPTARSIVDVTDEDTTPKKTKRPPASSMTNITTGHGSPAVVMGPLTYLPRGAIQIVGASTQPVAFIPTPPVKKEIHALPAPVKHEPALSTK